jgi:hypothetical protein
LASPTIPETLSSSAPHVAFLSAAVNEWSDVRVGLTEMKPTPFLACCNCALAPEGNSRAFPAH